MATTDIRFKRMNDEYQSVRNAQTALFDKVDSFEGALQELTEAVKRNNDMLEAIIKHLDIRISRIRFVSGNTASMAARILRRS